MNYVLDSWALLCLLQGEPGAEKVQKLIDLGRTEKAQLWVSWVNVAEVSVSIGAQQAVVIDRVD